MLILNKKTPMSGVISSNVNRIWHYPQVEFPFFATP